MGFTYAHSIGWIVIKAFSGSVLKETKFSSGDNRFYLDVIPCVYWILFCHFIMDVGIVWHRLIAFCW